MFEDDYPLLSMPSLVALILHRAAEGPVTLADCEAALMALFRRAEETPALPPEELRGKLSSHLDALEIARLLRRDGSSAWQLTERGRQTLERHPEGLDQTDLMKFPEYARHLHQTAHHPCGMDPRGSTYEAGYKAQRDGRSFTTNPHAFDSADHLAWGNGWMQAQEDARSQ
ncbi:hypothetical protein [Cribrihabitans neustonicus]|uniref:hypothetical protein n=1 Tax=Cribrihabitans neustonicus TaxID=1429085 RepID=UPI003B5B37D0